MQLVVQVLFICDALHANMIPHITYLEGGIGFMERLSRGITKVVGWLILSLEKDMT